MKTLYIRTADNIEQVSGYAKIAEIPSYTNQTFATNNNIAILTINYVGAFGGFGEQFIFSLVKNSNSTLKITPLNYTTKSKEIENILAYVETETGIDLYVKSSFNSTSVATKIIINELTYPFCKWINYSKFVDISSLNPSYSSNLVLNEENLNLDYGKNILSGSTNLYDVLMYSANVTFTNGEATKDLTSVIGDNTTIQRIQYSINESNTNCIITSGKIANKILTLQAYNNYNGNITVNVFIYIKK